MTGSFSPKSFLIHRYMYISLLLFMLIIAGCSSRSIQVQQWATAADQSKLLTQGDDLVLKQQASQASSIVIVDDKQIFQTVEGFGASMTESSGYAISKLPEDVQRSLMKDLFDPEAGLGINLLRQPMGSPDFALESYSYDDVGPGESDFDLSSFSIDRDREWILPYLKQALQINPGIKIMATPWSPPAWMKTGDSLMGASGGTLRKDCYDVYASYFVRFIQEDAAEGIPVFAVTPQNEIRYAPPQYSGMLLNPSDEAEFIGGYLGPAFEKAGLSVKIFCYDHNWDGYENAVVTLSNSRASAYVDGSAWHYYSGNADSMTRIHERFPEKEVWFTEGSIGTWIGQGSFRANFAYSMKMGIDIMRNWSKSIIWWNIALDEKNGPIVFKNSANHGLAGIQTATGKLMTPYRASYYSLGHFSRFVKRGAKRIASGEESGKIDSVAFQNPDGSIILVLFNRFSSAADTSVSWRGLVTEVRVPASGAITLVWKK